MNWIRFYDADIGLQFYYPPTAEAKLTYENLPSKKHRYLASVKFPSQEGCRREYRITWIDEVGNEAEDQFYKPSQKEWDDGHSDGPFLFVSWTHSTNRWVVVADGFATRSCLNSPAKTMKAVHEFTVFLNSLQWEI